MTPHTDATTTLAAIRQRVDATSATMKFTVTFVDTPDCNRANAELIANAPIDIRFLLDHVAALQRQLADAQARDRAADCGHGEQFLEMREALTAAGIDHIGLSVAESIKALVRQRDAAKSALSDVIFGVKYGDIPALKELLVAYEAATAQPADGQAGG